MTRRSGARVRLVLAAAVTAALLSMVAAPLDAQGRGRRDRESARRAATGKIVPRSYEEPAFARGYAEGLQRGQDAGRRKERYDPVGSLEYRAGDRGYAIAYGSRDAYKTNYRAGFRQGYEDGYRNAAR